MNNEDKNNEYYFIFSNDDLNEKDLNEKLSSKKINFLDGKSFEIYKEKKGSNYFYIYIDDTNNALKKIYLILYSGKNNEFYYINSNKEKSEIYINDFESKMENQFLNAYLDLTKKKKINFSEQYLIISSKEILPKLPSKYNNEFKLKIPPFKPIIGSEEINFKDFLDRHILILGETGSGKTYSAILPIVGALIDNIRNFAFSAFIVDPKQNEIKDFIMDKISDAEKENIIEIFNNDGGANYKIDLFEGIRDKDFETKMDYLFKLSPQFLIGFKDARNSQWSNFAKKLMINLLTIDYEIKNKIKKNQLKNFKYKDIFELFKESYKDKFNYKNDQGYFKKLSLLIDVLDYERSSKISDINKFLSDKDNNLPNISQMYENMYNDAFTSIQLSCAPFFNDIASNFIEELFITDPFEDEYEIKKKYGNRFISIKDSLLNRKIIIYSIPVKTIDAHILAATVIKKIVFRYSFETYEERKKDADNKIFYIADEFHRFITGDSESGEQSFLDRCRSYSVSCILATQSIASILYTLSNIDAGNKNSTEESLNIILNNVGTKLFFRSTDEKTQDKLKTFLPPNPYKRVDSGHVADVFTVSMLSRGECYFMTTSGKWGRTKIEIK